MASHLREGRAYKVVRHHNGDQA